MATLTDADKVLRNDTGKAIVSELETANALLAAIASGEGGIKINSFKDLQYLTRLGLASKVLSIGSQIEVEKASNMTATFGNSEGTAGITAVSVVREEFIHKMGTVHHGDYEFVYDGAAWHFNGETVALGEYGIYPQGTAKVGDEIVIHEQATTLVFDVIGIDVDTPVDSQFTHSVTLQMHDCFNSLLFDDKEAFYVAPAEGMAAGTYHFTVTEHPGYASAVNKTYQFTIPNAVAEGVQFVFNNSYNANFSTISAYTTGSSTNALFTATVTEGAGGTDLGNIGNAFNGTQMNSIQRALLGNNRWSQSTLRQWLNATKDAGGWWSMQNKWDRIPSYAGNTAGFLFDMDEDFVNSLGKVNKVTALNTVCDGGGSESLEEKVFLLSGDEVYGNHENGITEGTAYPYYSNYSDYSSPNDGADSNRIKMRGGSAQYWWLRSPNSVSAYHVRGIYPAGSVSSIGAYYTSGVAPACCII